MVGKLGKLKTSDGNSREGKITGTDGDFFIFVADVGGHTIYVNTRHIVEFVLRPESPKIAESVHDRWQSVFKQQSS